MTTTAAAETATGASRALGHDAEGVHHILTPTALQAAAAAHPAAPPATAPPAVRVVAGYRPGFLARCVDLQMAYYHAITGWGLDFETAIARDIGDILKRLPASPASQVWSALAPDDRILGTVLLDAAPAAEGEGEGEGPGQGQPPPRTAQLKGFIIDPAARGLGVGGKMLDAVMAHVRAAGLEQVTLNTMGSLAAAVHLYRKAGFAVEGTTQLVRWERSVPQMTLVWRAGAAPGRAEDGAAPEKTVGRVVE